MNETLVEKDAKIERLETEVRHAAETIVREKYFYLQLLARAADALEGGACAPEDRIALINGLREAAK